MPARKVLKILGDNGFQEIRRRGSHVVMQKRTPDATVTVVVPDHKQIRIGTLASIVRQSRLPRSCFES